MRSFRTATGLLLLLGCGCASGRYSPPDPAAAPLSLAGACAELADDSVHWSQMMRATALFTGTLRIDSDELERIATARTPDTVGMGGEHDKGWFAYLEIEDGKCLLGGRGVPDSFRPKIWIDERDSRLAQLREQNGGRVWFGSRKDEGLLGQLDGLHPIADSQRQLAAVICLMRAPLAELVAPVARPSPRVEAVTRELRAGSIGGQEALERLQPCDETLLPGLLHAMRRSLQQCHLDEGLVVGHRSLQLDGYNTSGRCSFDVLCFLSQYLRDFLCGQGDSDDDRAAEVRALAVDLRLRAPRER